MHSERLKAVESAVHFHGGKLLRRLRGQGSVTDSARYKGICARAASDSETFARFKREPAYTEVLEHVTCELGAGYLEIANAQSPELMECLDTFRGNDRIGDPRVCDYGDHGVFSPTTLRYVKVLSDLQTLFGPLNDMRILEIGVGYGGQCFITHAGGGFQSYTLVDLPPVLDLARRYLDELDVPNVRVEIDTAAYDLVVSNYAFSECSPKVQEGYLRDLIRPAARGYLTCNYLDGLGRDDLSARLPQARWTEERPLTAQRNEILVWGDRSL